MRELSEYDHDVIADLRTRDEFFWLDRDSPDEAALQAIADQLQWHPLAVEDTREWNQRPKLDDYRDHVLLVYYGLRSTSEPQDANPLEVHIRTNDVTKSLTIVATIFLPLSFVTGFFGQNFGWLVQRIGSFAAFWGLGVGSLLVSCVALFAWFRQRGWL